MKKTNLTILLFSAIFLLFSFSAGNAQNEFDDDPPPPQNEPDIRQNLLRELGLTQDQVRQIRIINAQRKPLMQEAQKRLRLANRDIDQAIYADAVDEIDLQLKLKEVQTAQAEVFKIRAMSEYEVRKILTPEQLVKFRDLRERFANRRNENQQRRQNRRQNQNIPPLNNKNQNPPLRRQNNRQKP